MATQLVEPVQAPGEEAQTGQDTEPHIEAQSPSEGRDWEGEARSHGWTPKEEFKGDPERWVDAESFMKRADEVMPLLKKQNQNLKREIDELKKAVRRLNKAEQNAYDAAIADIKREMEAAVESGDLGAYRSADQKMEKLREDVQSDLGTPHGEDPQEQFDSFREANPWYDKAGLASANETEIEARLYADRLADKYARQGLQNELSPSEFFARIAQETEAKFPLLRAKPARPKPASDVAGVTRPVQNRGAKTFANLPAEAQRQADRFFNQGVIKAKSLDEARAKYVADYQW